MALQKIDFNNEEQRHAFRHTSAHVLAQAIKELWPEAKLAIGPAIDDGFYYDIDLDHKIDENDLRMLEKAMKKIVKQNLPLVYHERTREEAIQWAKELNEDYKVELIEDLPEDEVISFYKQGEYDDLCAGPHVESTGVIKAFKLTSVAGAYWRGNSDKKMLQRIYGVSFPTQEELDDYLKKMEEAKKRDHRKIGKEMDLFMFSEFGPGFPFFLPNGMILRNQLINWWKEEHRKHDYVEIMTPIILNEQLWRTSGHWDHYQENMYFTKIDDEDYAIKPMNCPGAVLAYQRKLHSYRDLPVRMAEMGQVHRHELSGALHGLMRVRTFFQDDAHIIMMPEQTKEEVTAVINLFREMYAIFNFKYFVELSTRPDDSMGTEEEWELATNSLREAIEGAGMDYVINEGDGAFYGPKLDFHIEDAVGRTWQCGTIQLDMQMPERFGVTYIGADGAKHVPWMIHRTVFGSIERFIGIMIEHFEGKFPLWLAPVQVKLLTVTEKFNSHAEEICAKLHNAGIRAVVDGRNEKIGYKMREARNERVSYIGVIGEREVEDGTLSVRSTKAGELGAIDVDEFTEKLLKEIQEKAL